MQTVQRQICSDLYYPLESAFFIRSRLATTSYLRQKGKASTDTEKKTLNVTFGSWFFLFDFEMVFLNAWKNLH